MKTACVLATILASAAAFAPASVSNIRSTSLAASEFENEAGVLPPVGFFDPAKLSSGISQERFDSFRLAELKHGRVCMMAILGYVATETYHFPGDLYPGTPFASIPTGYAAIAAVPLLGWLQIIWTVGIIETTGNLGTYDIGFLDLTPEEYFKRQTQELQHGRLAMLAFLELARHDTQTLAGNDNGLDHLISGLPFIY
ncbi:fucoxanthin chlorophyll a/c protein, lhcf type [Fragilariopsis cylindrus CCMP1102]|jgi:hypothetical protein|uniref:Fucoxanthin chlorophyll a/c protein, lhcf type n=1 Tax=Fragilariopsis cylindrus CCMP1102 TaxID=635003 RepID=A0A1E7ETL9_9STRA|nr:fucoxanthin chlorophyll a/c protein, lhcf type [Fragilariopsis cylindrus CCMP1102]|eukprot:OEU09134.1 fucoxanthin chlorophyll a/c protein, lhcf type [Fragilariopsis cylindrus CCMP1102]